MTSRAMSDSVDQQQSGLNPVAMLVYKGHAATGAIVLSKKGLMLWAMSGSVALPQPRKLSSGSVIYKNFKFLFINIKCLRTKLSFNHGCRNVTLFLQQNSERRNDGK
ncbi:hypothetical protein STEG23_037015, partial [Scotinomys teguina]